MKKTTNGVLFLAVLILFASNMWLFRAHLNSLTDLELLRHLGQLKEMSKQVMSHDCDPQLCSNACNVDVDKAVILGHRKQTKDFLTIAIPTVNRKEENYLIETVNSLIANTSPDDRSSVTLVIFIANTEEYIRNDIRNRLETVYQKYFNEGFMQLIVAPPSIYPPLNNLKQNFGDSKERVRWRAKQVIDYAYLFTYCRDLSEYYLQLEDDVISTPDFLGSIRDFIAVNSPKKWTVLEFSELGFIGKLLRSSELARLSWFVMFFYEDQPVDYLLKYYIHLNAQEGTFLHNPSLFQHVGRQSSLQNKQQDLVGRFFDANKGRKYYSDNPPAVLYSSMETFGMYVVQLAYSSKPGFFWGQTPILGDTLLVVFDRPARLSRVVIETGSEANPEDFLRSGKLEISPVVSSVSADSTPRCREYEFVAQFKSRVDVGDMEHKFNIDSRCLQVTVLKSQQQWLLVREIAVWVHRG